LARKLGISCAISPDHMVNATVPDKLAIASFVYQLYSFFNENIPSAVVSLNNNTNMPALPENGMAEFDKITMAKLNSESSLGNTTGDQQRLSSDRLRKYSRHRLEDNTNDNVATDIQPVNDDAATNDKIVTELFPIVQPSSSNIVDENISEEPSPSNVDNIDEMFPRVGGSSAVKEDASTDEVAANGIPNVVVNSPTDNFVLSRIHAKSPEQNITTERKITAEEMTEDVVIVRRDSYSQPTVSEQQSDNVTSEDQGVINLDVTVNEIAVSAL